MVDESQVVWQCECGSTSFFLRFDDEVECNNCGVIQAAEHAKSNWTELAKDSRISNDKKPSIHYTSNDETINFSLEFMKRKAFSPSAQYIIVIEHNGAVHHLGWPENANEAKKFKQSLKTAKTGILKKLPHAPHSDS